jgi:MFS superfamily sulfate permease-like transporter
MSFATSEVPRGNAAGFKKYFRYDFVSGLLVFLIALPLCLGISLACGYPPLAGIMTAIIGSLLTTFISNSELTIKGPAAGLIVIAVGCIEDFGGDGAVGGFTATDMTAYKMALAVGVAAAVLQILFGALRAGILGEFFPVSAIHGMLAAIGVIIISKQLPIVLGVDARGEPLQLLSRLPEFILEANPAIALMGGTGLLIMFLWPVLQNKWRVLKSAPAPLVVLLVVVPMAMAFDLMHAHSYFLQGHKYQLGEQYLVRMPDRVFGMFEEITFPDFSALRLPSAWKWVFMFFVIGSLESLLSTKAIDVLDPWKRKTNLDRDITAVGIANLASALVGGLPMISEIVRSKANIDNGARTRFADMWHGVFLLVCVALIPMFLHRIPLAALASMLVYTGFRLAHPKEFVHIYHVGREQLVIFVVTVIAVLATDLLIGIAIGIGVKIMFHIFNGAPLSSLFKPYLEITVENENTCRVVAHQSAVFSNWIPFRREIQNLGLAERKNVIVDLADTKFVDHSVMDRLAAMQQDFAQEGLSLVIEGLDRHQQLSRHEFSARKRGLGRARRLTVIADAAHEQWLTEEFVKRGATGYTIIPCVGAGLRNLFDTQRSVTPQVRIEVIVPADVCEAMVTFFRRETRPEHHLTVCLEAVDVLNMEQFKRDEVEGAGYQNLGANRPYVRETDAPRPWSGTWIIHKTRAALEGPARFYRRRKIPSVLRGYGLTPELVREIVDGYHAYAKDDVSSRDGDDSLRDRSGNGNALDAYLEMNYPFLVPQDNAAMRQAVRKFFLEETCQPTGLD